MLSIYTSARKRRVWSPATVALSLAAHVLLLGGVVVAATGEPERPPVVYLPLDPYVVPPEPAPPAPPAAAPAPLPEEPPAPQQETPGDFVRPTPPDQVPQGLPEIDPDARPLTQAEVRGIGVEGTVFDPTRGRRGEGEGPAVSTGGGVFEPGAVDALPELRNGREMERLLQRSYPPLLQQAGVTGRTELRLVVDAEGRVEPGSITVLASTDPGFAEASVKVAERFRFRPATVGGRPVRVMIRIPIQWTLDGR